jgi:CheY-like chemotaxis protein
MMSLAPTYSSRPAACPSYPPSILLIDADGDTRALYRQSVESLGYDVEEASDGREALVKALSRPPALVITELVLPFLDGYALCGILRRDGATAGVPILAITTETRLAELDRARHAGADTILVKPTVIDDVISELFRLLDAFKDGRPMPTPGVASPNDAVTPLPSPRRGGQSKAFVRYVTMTPPLAPPPMLCPTCDHPLVYEQSRIGGVSERYREQWDRYTCVTCGTFQYRHRTRTLSQAS